MTLPGSSRTAQLGCSGRDSSAAEPPLCREGGTSHSSPPQTALHGHWKSNPEQLCCEAEGARCHCLHRMQVFLSWEQLPLPTSKSPGRVGLFRTARCRGLFGTGNCCVLGSFSSSLGQCPSHCRAAQLQGSAVGSGPRAHTFLSSLLLAVLPPSGS